ncbi:MAG: pyridoxamine 5'-phosphate oxidase family protein [Alphaproteobacteria bacterium]|nr:pyridoxamine 5'-phosphate oxidase family protein [Alphaproteobacteria bacterium]
MIDSVLNVVKSCDAVVLATCGALYPDARHLTNAMNRDASDLTLYFMTGRNTPKYKQLQQNPNCALYYFNSQTRHSVRLYGKIEFVTDMIIRQQYWRDEYKKFGYSGAESDDFILMRFIPNSYKFYIGGDIKTGII